MVGQGVVVAIEHVRSNDGKNKRDALSAATHQVTVTRASGRIHLDGFLVLR
jgi:hypothetical protein